MAKKSLSSAKAARQNEKRRTENRGRRQTVRTVIRTAREAIVSEPAESEAAVKAAVRALDVARSRGVVYKRNAARRKSRLMKQLNKAKSAAS
ncbi:MAG: 30S ribosomal protein S20 [Chloroflexi bacterium]|nr:30S ribosomal protein S20 [Chloroflexota bacterium]